MTPEPELRVLAVIHGPAYGGAHNQLVRLAAPLRARGVELIAVLPEEASAAAARMTSGGVETLRMPLSRLRASPDPRLAAGLLRSLRPQVRALASLVKKRGVDVVQPHGATNPHGALAARRAGAAVVWQLFDTRAPLALRRIAMPLVLSRADAITVWGEALLDGHPGARRLGERAIVVYPPVDVDEFAPDAAARAHARSELGIPDRGLAVGTVGVLNPQKGHEHLLAATALLTPEFPGLRLRLLGGSSPAHARYERSLRAAAAKIGDGDIARFADPTGRVADLLPALDVFALTSVPRSEGMPTAILEAMACAIPVVATDVGAVRELFDDGVEGLLVPPGDNGAIAGAIRRLLENPDLRRRLGQAGRKRALESFGIEPLADLHAGAYRVALEHRANAA